MGSWGPGIFSDDLAADVREEWRRAILDGGDATQASDALIARYDGQLAGDGADTVFWAGLAAAQMETGRLQPGVRDRALALIDAGGDIELWQETGEASIRERVLRRLAEKLRGPQPAPKKLRRPPAGPDPGVEAGDVVRLWNTARTRSALFAVISVDDVERGRWRWPTLLGLY